MNIKEIVTYGSPVLRQNAQAVEDVDDNIRELIREMSGSLRYHQGAGLAAPQVGESLRLFLSDDGHGIKVFINPEIIETQGNTSFEEGCLSLPGIYVDISRPSWVKVRYLDENGEPRELEAENLLARIIQHEYDHLEGVLICDRAGFLAKKLMNKKLRRLEKEGYHG